MRVRLPRYSRRTTALLIIAMIGLFAIGGGVYAALLGGGGNGSTLSSSPINLDQGLVANYKFDGNAKDSTPFSNNGAVTSASLTTDRKAKANSAYNFNGTTSHITVPNSTSNDIADHGSVTMCAWVLLPGGTTGSYMGVMAKRANGDTNYAYGINIRTNEVQVYTKLTAGYSISQQFAYNIPTAQWTQLCAVMSAAPTKLYVNGSLFGSLGTGGGVSSNPAAAFNIGSSDSTGNEPFNGSIDDVRVYNRVLNASEVNALYTYYDQALKLNSGANGLVAQYKFDSDTKDSSPYGNNGVNSGATSTTDREGKASSAISFNGTTNYVEAPDQAQDDSNVGSWSGWFKVNAAPVGNEAAMIAKSTTTGDSSSGIHIAIKSDGKLQIQVKQVGNITIWSYTGASSIVDGRWHHFALVYNSNTLVTLYMDGVSVASSVPNNSWAFANPSPLRFGKSYDGYWNLYNGSIDDFRIYKRLLTSGEVTSLYNAYDATFRISDLQKGLVSDWALNGNAKDSTPYGNSCSVTAGSSLTADRKGRANSSYSFNGSTQGLSCGVNGNQPSAGVTVTAWVNPTSCPSASFNGIYNNGTGGYWIYLDPSCGLGFYVTTSISLPAGGSLGSGVIVPTGTWHMVTGTYDGTTRRIYYDGAQVASDAITGVLNDYTSPSYIGSIKGATNRSFNGSIDDVRVWGRALTASEIQALYSSYR